MYLSFFFSSRRRHTRCLSDWSSDVCSSDLMSTVDDDQQVRAVDAAAAVGVRRTAHRLTFVRDAIVVGVLARSVLNVTLIPYAVAVAVQRQRADHPRGGSKTGRLAIVADRADVPCTWRSEQLPTVVLNAIVISP